MTSVCWLLDEFNSAKCNMKPHWKAISETSFDTSLVGSPQQQQSRFFSRKHFFLSFLHEPVREPSNMILSLTNILMQTECLQRLLVFLTKVKKSLE